MCIFRKIFPKYAHIFAIKNYAAWGVGSGTIVPVIYHYFTIEWSLLKIQFNINH